MIKKIKDTFKKIYWRTKFLMFESLNKDWKVVAYTIFPFARKKNFRINLLINKGIIKHKKNEDFIEYKDLRFYCGKHVPIADFMGIFLSNNKYIYNNFINNSAFRLEGPYEEGGVKLKIGDIVIDAGSNLGFFAILAGEKIGTNGKVFAFEPVKKTSEILNKNISYNNLLNIKVIENALGDKESELNFAINEDILGCSSNVLREGKNKIEKVKQITLDNFVEDNDLEKIDFIKADIEGMERNLIKGAEKTIKRFKPNLSICIYHLPDDPEVIEKLILDYVPEYNIKKTKQKIFAWV
ncbi:FkbM family methyltransferase [Patescibacteria group bacterium]|nr:FkbM family methyltransferase [Patescibacteria group bacterium]